MNQASSSTSQFASTLKTVAVNMAIMIAINVGIKLLSKAWDTLNVTVEEQESKINELQSSYESLKAEYDDLSQKQDITDAEKHRLEYLERRLELDNRILEAEKAQLFNEKTGNKFTDLFDEDNLNTQYLGEMNHNNRDGYVGLSRIYDNNTSNIDNIHERITKLKELQATVEEGTDKWRYYQAELDTLSNQETKYIDKLSESEYQLNNNLAKYADNIEYLQSQLDSGDLTEGQTATAEEQLATWQKLYDETDAMIIQIKKLNGTYDDTAERVASKYSVELNRAKTYLGGYEYNDRGSAATNETGRQLSDFWDENVLSGANEETEQNIELWNKVTEGINDATKAMEAYTEAKKNAGAETLSDDISSIIPTISSSVQQLATQLEPQFAKLGEAYKAIFTSDGFTLGDVDNSMLEGLRESFAEIEEEIGVAFDASVLDPFFDTLTNGNSTANDVQQAFNDLATAYFYSTDTLEQLNEETAESITKQLEEMGVVNAEEIVMNALAEAKARAFLASYDLADATNADITAMLNEAESAGIASDMIFKLVTEEQVFNAQGLSTDGKVAQLKELANAYGQTAVAAKIARMEDEYTKSHQAINYEEIAKAAQAEINNAVNSVHVDFKGANSSKKSGSGGSGSSKDKYKEAYDKELKELEHMHEMGLISDEEYWQARLDLNEKYFGESSGMHQKYLDEYQKNEEDILKGLKDLWKDYYEGRKDNLKDLISYASKLHDKEIDSLESSIKVIEKKRDAEKKHWQDQIDALKDANEERERAIDLQEKQWALQKAMHQRTILLYSENLGMHYVNDSKAERDAKNDLDNTENDNKIAELEKQLDAILEVYDSQIESINIQIDRLKEVKSAWSEIVDNQELKELEERLKSIFGGDVKDKILSGNTDFINSIISQYSTTSDTLRMIEDATLADIRNMVAQYGVLPENLMPIANAAVDINNALGTVDTTGFNTNLDNTAQSSSNAAEKVQSATTALNNLSNDISNYQMPELNADNFAASFAEDGTILTTIKGFIERFKEICDDIPDIWDNSLSKAFSAGGGNGDPLAGGLPNDTKYEELFSPLLTAIDNCKLNLEEKLNACSETFKNFHSDISGVIGVGGSSSTVTSPSGTKGNSGQGSGGEKKSGSVSGSYTIVGSVQEGGSLIDEALNGEGGWSASFDTAKESIHESATSIVECIESMAETIVSACSAAIEAINMVANADENSGNNPAPNPYGRSGHGHSEIGNAYATGIKGLPRDEKNALVSEYGQTEMTVLPNGKTIITDAPTPLDLPKGTVVYNEEQTKKILNNKPDTSGNAYAKGTTNTIDKEIVLADGTVIRPLQPGDRAYELQKAFEPLLEKWKNGQLEIVSNAFYDGQKQFEKWTKEITNNTAINNITNNRNVQPTVHQEIHVTMPNVTNSTSAERILKDLESLATKKMQVNW